MNIEWIKNKLGQKIYPVTHTKAILHKDDNITLDDALTDLNKELTDLSNAISGVSSALPNKANAVHTHSISDVTGLQGALNGKAASTHSHAISDITNLQATLNGKASTAVATQSADGLMSAADKVFLDLLRNKLYGHTIAEPSLSGTTLNINGNTIS